MEKKDNEERLNTIVYTTFEIIRKVSFMLYPIIPESSLKALEIFGINENDINYSSISNNNYLKPGNKINKIGILFKKIEKMIDSHCHLDHEPCINDLENIIKRSKDIGIQKLLTICTTHKSLKIF